MSTFGICYQLEATLRLGNKKTIDILWIIFEINKSTTFIHDPNFFLASANPGFSLNMMTIGKPMKMHIFKLVLHKNIVLVSKPCNPSPLYSFTRCIKTGISREVGYRLHWDRWISQQLPTCHHLEQYRSMHNLSSDQNN